MALLSPLADGTKRHNLVETTFLKFTDCLLCRTWNVIHYQQKPKETFIWGLHKQGYKCSECGFTCHKKCRDECRSSSPCQTLDPSLSREASPGEIGSSASASALSLISAGSPPLPEGWLAHFDAASQHVYYYHTPSGVTQWTHPVTNAPTARDSVSEKSRRKSQLAMLENEISSVNADDSKECVVCLEAERQSIFYPCGHKVCCVPCAKSIRSGSGVCPVCRNSILDTIDKVFD